MPDYRLSLLFRIQSLTELDRSKVSVEEKVKNTLVKNSIVFIIQLTKNIRRDLSSAKIWILLAVTVIRGIPWVISQVANLLPPSCRAFTCNPQWNSFGKFFV